MNENKIDMGNLEKAVAEVTDSIAVGKFVVKAVEAAMELRAGLSREQTQSAMLSHQANGRPNVCKTAVWLAQRP